MANIEKRYIIDSNKLSGEFYFASFLQEAYSYGFLNESDLENIQLECAQFLAYKSERYNMGESSSIRTEVAGNIMKSNFYTIGLYLKSLPDVDYAVKELKRARVSEMYEKGRKLIHEKFAIAKYIYKLVQENKTITINYSYNATLSKNGIRIFFKSYNPDYEAHEIPGSIDYQLCNPVADLAGVEFIQKYLENLYLENMFCRYFDSKAIHHLLYGYDEGYKDLLINIFEQVLIAALGCSLVNRNIVKLNISIKDIQYLYNELWGNDDYEIAMKLYKGMERIINELNITNYSLGRYIKKSMTKIISDIGYAVKTEILDKVFVSPIDPKLKPKIQFLSEKKMDDKEYRKLIDELLICRYSSDKLALIKEKVKSFDDLEDLLFDAQLIQEEVASILDTLTDMEIAAMVKRHPFNSEVQAIDLSEDEQELRIYLKSFIDNLPVDRQERIFEIANHLIHEG